MRVNQIVSEARWIGKDEFLGFVWDTDSNMLTRPDGSTVRAPDQESARRSATTWNRRNARVSSSSGWRNWKRRANRAGRFDSLPLDKIDGWFAKFVNRLSRFPFIAKAPWIIMITSIFWDFFSITMYHLEQAKEAEERGEDYDTASLISAQIWEHGKAVLPAMIRQAVVWWATIALVKRYMSRIINVIMWTVRGAGLAFGPGAPFVWIGSFATQVGLSIFMATDYGQEKMRQAWIFFLETFLPFFIGAIANTAVSLGLEEAGAVGDTVNSGLDTLADGLKTRMESEAESIIAGMSEFGNELTIDNPEDIPPELRNQAPGAATPSSNAAPQPAPTQSFRSIAGSGTW